MNPTTISPDLPQAPAPRARRRLARATAITLLALTGAGVTAVGAYAATSPQPRDANGNLSNSVTSTSPGANCVTGAEAGCTVVPLATPMLDPAVGGVTLAAGALAGLGVITVRRRRTGATA